jgi:hypothetical protein
MAKGLGPLLGLVLLVLYCGYGRTPTYAQDSITIASASKEQKELLAALTGVWSDGQIVELMLQLDVDAPIVVINGTGIRVQLVTVGKQPGVVEVESVDTTQRLQFSAEKFGSGVRMAIMLNGRPASVPLVYYARPLTTGDRMFIAERAAKNRDAAGTDPVLSSLSEHQRQLLVRTSGLWQEAGTTNEMLVEFDVEEKSVVTQGVRMRMHILAVGEQPGLLVMQPFTSTDRWGFQLTPSGAANPQLVFSFNGKAEGSPLHFLRPLTAADRKRIATIKPSN